MALTNTELKNFKLLRTQRRVDRSRFLAEGVRLLEESVRHRVKAETVLVCDDQLGDRGRTLVGRMERLGGEIRRLPARQLDAIADAETSQGIAAVFVRPEVNLGQLELVKDRRVLVCDGISDPGNLGTLFRSALAFGFTIVAVCGESADAFAPKTVRASVGAVFGLTIVEANANEVLQCLARNKIILLAAEAGGKPLSSVAVHLLKSTASALAVGSEAHGLSTEIRKASAHSVGISHESTVESLNAAVAGSILMKGIYDLCQGTRTRS
jgi:TrmH family RNA methyltransferase